MSRRGSDLPIVVQQARDTLDECRRNFSARQLRPLHLVELVWNLIIVPGVVDDDRQQERFAGGHEMRAIDGELPLKAEITLFAHVRVLRDDRNEKEHRS